MTQDVPLQIKIFAYQVGFGDCHLLQFIYAAYKRHILIDFGSHKNSGYANKKFARGVADAIAGHCEGNLDAVVVSHRHQDHLYGFGTGDGWPGDVIAGCHPKLVVQPWTEDPRLAAEATGPIGEIGLTDTGSANARFVRSLNELSEIVQKIHHDRQGKNFGIDNLMAAYAQDPLSNKSAIDNLQAMGGKPGASSRYVHFGSDSGLGDLLPGVDVQVLGPPTLDQCPAIKKETDVDQNEFWMLKRAKSEDVSTGIETGTPSGTLTELPVYVRWLALKLNHDMEKMREEQIMQIVRQLDNAMNNTSVILLFSVGNQKLLFPGDAQIENWQYAFDQPGVRELLKDVTVYKVGHHGSRNATPKSLWKKFSHRSASAQKPDRLITLLSSQDTIFKNTEDHTEVPRITLETELKKKSQLYSTMDLEKHPGACFEITLDVLPV